MKTSASMRFKAIFLTIVFLLNTMVGFACTLGMNIGFNKSHDTGPHALANTIKHSHPAGTKKHTHKASKKEAPSHCHKQKTSKNTKANCCKDEVAKFVSIDKQAVKHTSVKVPTLLAKVTIPLYQQLNILSIGSHTPDNSYFLRCHHPPIPDIRIAVQSFQI